MRTAAIGALAALLAGCASMGRLMEYGTDLADARPTLPGGYHLSLYVHPREDVFLVQGAMNQSNQSTAWGPPVYRGAVIYLIRPVGCDAGQATLIAAGSYEVPFTCPAGVDLRRMLREQHDAAVAGQPLRP